MKRLLLFLALTGPVGFQQALLTLSGASCVEELSEDEMQRYQSLAAHPVDLNLAGRSRLLATGLLSPFQVASLLDYRSRSGAVLSWTELALVDGFGADFVEALRVFAVLGEGFSEAPGARPSKRLAGSVTLRGSGRYSDASWAGAAGVKLEASVGERAALFLSARNTLSDQQIAAPTFSAAYYGRRVLGQLILGHFQARFGQGLLQWSGFQLSGYNSLGAFRRNGTGLSPTGSFNPSLMGVASDWHFGHWRLSAAYSFTGREPIGNVAYVGRSFSASLTANGAGASLEGRFALRGGWSLFGETALSYDGVWRSLGGTVFVPAYGHRLGLLARWYGPSDKRYSGLAAGYEGPVWSLTADAGLRTDTGAAQYKALLQWKPAIELGGAADSSASASTGNTVVRHSPVPGAVIFRPSLRFAARLRPGDAVSGSPSSSDAGGGDWAFWRREALRLEGRGTVTLELGPWTLGGRYDAVWGRGFAWNWYAEAGRRTDRFSLWLRGGIFKVDDWDDRIYVYERDAPGSFTVPARYGRGWNASLYAAWQPSRHQGLWLRLETVQYPWNLSPKPGRLDARLQYRYRW